MNYRSKSISLAEDVWRAFDVAADVHGSYNKFLRHVFTVGGKFAPEKALKTPLLSTQPTAAKVRQTRKQK